MWRNDGVMGLQHYNVPAYSKLDSFPSLALPRSGSEGVSHPITQIAQSGPLAFCQLGIIFQVSGLNFNTDKWRNAKIYI